jgi:gamma-glutamyl-gamma-aminobutyrate hydrolase PuuD
MIRIGLTQRVIVFSDVAERRDSLDQRWTSLLTGLGFVPVPIPNMLDDIEAYLDELKLDGVILTGGGDLVEYATAERATPERDRVEHALIDYCLSHDLPLLGVCRGLQALVNHFGGRLRPVQEHVAVRHQVRFDDSYAEGVVRPADVNSFHDFGLTEDDLPKELLAFAWADDEAVGPVGTGGTIATVEGAAMDGRAVTGIMWHAEREESLVEWDRALILGMFGGGKD